MTDGGGTGGSSGEEDGPASTTTSTTTTTTTNTTTTTTTNTTTTTSTSTSAGTDDGSDDGRPKFDLAPADLGELEPEPVPPAECADPGGENFPCSYEGEPGSSLHYRCMPLPPEGDCDTIDPWTAVQDANDCLGDPIIEDCVGWEFVEVACASDPSVTDACCNWLVFGPGFYCPGRPFTVDGRERLAASRSCALWAEFLQFESLAPLSPRERTALADAWTQCALFEHASVASFSRFALQLLAAGAPAQLVASAQQAMREELEHARTFFGLASAYAGAPIGPGLLRIDGALRDADNLPAVAAAAASEGCIAETISALHIAIAASHARDPIVAQRLRAIAEEELRHAELAWTFVAWALHHGPPAVRTAVANVFATPHRSIPRAAALDDSLPSALYLGHGLLPAEHRDPLTQSAVTEIILPAARRLLTPSAEKRNLEPAGRGEGR